MSVTVAALDGFRGTKEPASTTKRLASNVRIARYRMPLMRALCLVFAAAFAVLQAPAARSASEEDVVMRSTATIDELKSHPQLAALRETLQRAEAIVVMPEVSGNAFLVGGEGGKGVLVARQPDGWSYPAFYSLGAGTVSPRAGNGLSKLVLVVMTKGGLEKLLADR